MTKEELRKEAEGYTNKLLEDWELYDPEALQEAYIAGAELREKQIAELKALNKELQCCANCRHSYGGEEEPFHDCGYCHAMNCICKLKLKEHTSDIYRMWEDKCDKWEMRVN